MFELTKDFRFETAHRLAAGYVGKCSNIHGHSWNGQLIVKAGKLDEFGMAIDFAIMKKIIKPLEDKLDHGIMLHAEDKELIALCEKNNWKVIKFPENPTSEVVAEWFYNKAVQLAADEALPIIIEAVVIKETCTSSCKFSRG